MKRTIGVVKHTAVQRFNHVLYATVFAAAAALSACGGGSDDAPDRQSWLGQPVAPGKAAGASGAASEVAASGNAGTAGSGTNGTSNGVAGGGSSGGGSSGGGSSGGGSSGGSSSGGSSSGGSSSGGSSSGGSSSGGSSSGGSSSGGSTSGDSSSGSGSSTDTPTNNPDSGTVTPDTDTTTPPTAANTAPIIIDRALGLTVNQPYVTVKLCIPNTHSATQCATIDHMLLDTGSIGIRVFADELGNTLAAHLPQQTGAANDTSSAAPLVQCALFGSGFLWGSLRRADVSIGGMTAADLPVQIVGDTTYPTAPADCVSRGGADLGTIAALGAKGIVGIGHRARDFPQAAQTPMAASYYYCASPTSCTAARVPLERQTMNPVAGFATDNNGTIIRLPALPPQGQASVTGELIFGVGTRENNALPGNTKVLPVTEQGTLTTLYANRSLSAMIDSGTNGLLFRDASIATNLLTWYTPQTVMNLAATLMSVTGMQAAVPFSIANADQLFDLNYAAHDNLGAMALSSNMFVWGLPFYYGRSVYTVLSGTQAGTKTGPFVAF